MLVYCYLLLDVFNKVYFYKNPSKLEPTYFPFPDWRNTPTEGVGSSWVQRLCGRRKRMFLPTASSLLKPTAPSVVREKLLKKEERWTFNYNRDTLELPLLYKK